MESKEKRRCSLRNLRRSSTVGVVNKSLIDTIVLNGGKGDDHMFSYGSTWVDKRDLDLCTSKFGMCTNVPQYAQDKEQTKDHQDVHLQWPVLENRDNITRDKADTNSICLEMSFAEKPVEKSRSSCSPEDVIVCSYSERDAVTLLSNSLLVDQPRCNNIENKGGEDFFTDMRTSFENEGRQNLTSCESDSNADNLNRGFISQSDSDSSSTTSTSIPSPSSDPALPSSRNCTWPSVHDRSIEHIINQLSSKLQDLQTQTSNIAKDKLSPIAFPKTDHMASMLDSSHGVFVSNSIGCKSDTAVKNSDGKPKHIKNGKTIVDREKTGGKNRKADDNASKSLRGHLPKAKNSCTKSSVQSKSDTCLMSKTKNGNIKKSSSAADRSYNCHLSRSVNSDIKTSIEGASKSNICHGSYTRNSDIKIPNKSLDKSDQCHLVDSENPGITLAPGAAFHLEKRNRLSLKKPHHASGEFNTKSSKKPGRPKANTRKLETETSDNKHLTPLNVNNQELASNAELKEKLKDYIFLDSELENSILQALESEEFWFDSHFDFCESEERVKGKKQNKDSAKSQRRSSRYFSLQEMPLREVCGIQELPLSCFESASSPMSENPTPAAQSPDTNEDNNIFTDSLYFDNKGIKSCNENKENCADNSEEALKSLHPEEYSYLFIEDIRKTQNGFKPELLEEVVEDFISLCVNETDRIAQGNKKKEEEQARSRRERKKRKSSNIYKANDIDSYVLGGDPSNILCSQAQAIVPDCLSNDKALSYANAETLGLNRLDEAMILRDNIEETEGGELANENGNQGIQNIERKEVNDDNDVSDVTLEADDTKSEPRNLKTRWSRKSWGKAQPTNTGRQQSGGRRGEGYESNSDSSPQICASAGDSLTQDNEDSYVSISEGLENFYRNKNYVLPPPRAWETIKENPNPNQTLFTKKRYKCYLAFDSKISQAKLQRRHKKALEMCRKGVNNVVSLTDEEFEQKMLDVQLFLDSSPMTASAN